MSTDCHPLNIDIVQVHAKIYPTLAQIALDVLPAQASSVPCEWLFSGGKEIADDRRSRLGAARFEELQMLKFAWRDFQIDHAALNSSELEELDLDEFEGLLEADIKFSEFDIDAAIETYVVE